MELALINEISLFESLGFFFLSQLIPASNVPDIRQIVYCSSAFSSSNPEPSNQAWVGCIGREQWLKGAGGMLLPRPALAKKRATSVISESHKVVLEGTIYMALI